MDNSDLNVAGETPNENVTKPQPAELNQPANPLQVNLEREDV